MDRTTKVMVNRSWKPFVDKGTGKWLTGYAEGYAQQLRDPLVEDHEIRILEITPTGTGRGRSAAYITFEDREGHNYNMSLTGGFELIKAYLHGKIRGNGEFMIGRFNQVKKGSSLFIEVVKDNEKMILKGAIS